MNPKFYKHLSAWTPVLLWAYIIFHFSSGTVPVASDVYWQDFAVKKIGHILLFGAMSLLVYRAFRIEGISRKESAIYAILISTFYGATDEFHQMFTQGRESRVRDVFIDGIGASLVAAVLFYLPSKLPKTLGIAFHKINLD